MAAHMLIGILIGVVCGIAALLVISIVTLRRIDLEWRTENARLQRALMDLQRSVERSARGVRDDIVAPAPAPSALPADAVMP